MSDLAAAAAVRTDVLGLLAHASANTESRLGERPDLPRFLTLLLLALLLVLAQGCASPKRNALPENLYDSSQVPGVSEARYWGDATPPYAERLVSMSPEELAARFPALVGQPITFLAISRGGSDGAFSAGLLNGWTESGTRPEFSLVTGVSTGSLVAPFAFLGSAYDAKLKEVFTTTSDKDIFKKRGMLAILNSDAVADNSPLRAKGVTKVYVIRNAKLEPAWKTMDRKVLDIATRSTASLIRTQGIGDLFIEYVGATEYGFDFNIAFISSTFDATPKEGTVFDPGYMKKLYDFGYDSARNGYPWIKRPPAGAALTR
jgi:hypothetical protein